MKLTISQKIDLAQVGATEEDQHLVCLLANTVRQRTRAMLQNEVKKMRRARENK
jgi:hypothetical protein